MTHNDIHLLLTGDELMSGDTVDSNSSMIAQSLAAFGHGVAEKVTLGDDRARLVAALQRAAGTARIAPKRTFDAKAPKTIENVNTAKAKL